MANVYLLSQADRDAVERVLGILGRAPPNAPNRPAVGPWDDVPQAPEVYVARTPAGGIPALVEQAGTGIADQPGSATCRVYRLLPQAGGKRLRPIPGLTKLVYNLSNSPIGAFRWVLVARDKLGDWFVVAIYPVPDAPFSGGGDTGTGDTGTGTVPAFPPDFPPGFLVCESSGFWVYRYACEPVSDHTIITFPGGVGTGSGTVTSLYLLNEYRQRVVFSQAADGCAGVAVGDWEFSRTVSCCDPTCADRQWYCLDEPEETGTGASTGTGTGEGEGEVPIIPTDCCPSVLLPERLTVTITDKTGDCADCLPDSFEVVWDGFNWNSEDIGGSCAGAIDFDLACSTGSGCTAFRLGSTSEGVSQFAAGGCSCDPLLLTFPIEFVTCVGTATLIVTE